MDGIKGLKSSVSSPTKILVPLSFGLSSLALLHFMTKYVQRQRQKTGRQTYKILFHHVFSFEDDHQSLNVQIFQALRDQHPEHELLSSSIDSVSARLREEVRLSQHGDTPGAHMEEGCDVSLRTLLSSI